MQSSEKWHKKNFKVQEGWSQERGSIWLGALAFPAGWSNYIATGSVVKISTDN